MLGRPRTGSAQSALDGAMAALRDLFTASGHDLIDPPHLFLGETLLNLYGEDLRARAFLFADAERGNELCLRPDFTVPVALAHADRGWDSHAAYAYAGPVFRRQPRGQGRPVEYMQAGVERFRDTDPIGTEAEVLALLLKGLSTLGVQDRRITIGDLSIPIALLDALDITATCRSGLRRHIWRPNRFQDLLRRAVEQPSPAPGLPESQDAALDLIRRSGEPVGLRNTQEVLNRVQALTASRPDAGMLAQDARLLEQVFAIKGPAPQALADLRTLTKSAGIDQTIDQFEARLDALACKGIDPADLAFDAAFGRNLEYYDGFVFEVAHPAGDHPPVAGGGRYDSMTTRLGAPDPVAAIGGVIRPQAVLEATS